MGCKMRDNHNPEQICEKQESNLRTPARIDLESIPVDHLGILARDNIGSGIKKDFEMKKGSSPENHYYVLSPPLLAT
jgi:hypothetical protein